jgi:CubicO group peptidase (beta-lactamase class C family)
VESGIAPDDQTRYNINSLTKATIAALVGIEVNRGSLKWDGKIRTYLPEFLSDSLEVEEKATIIALLSHRTGIACPDAPWLQSNNTILMQRDRILPLFATLKPVQEFCTSFCYNNLGYEIVALILEKVSGLPLSELLRVNVLEPLGMHRTSTSWHTDDDNVAKSYSVLDDLTSVEIVRPQLGDGSLMEAAGGVKSTLHDLIIWQKAWLAAINPSCEAFAQDSARSVLKECCTIIDSHAHFPGTSLLEQSYAAGWARAQLPGQLGRISQNVIIGQEPIVGRGANSCLVIYHHGSMPGSTSVVNLIPETGSAVIVLQNSLAPIDTADFVGQMLVEAVLGVLEPNDYIHLAQELTD